MIGPLLGALLLTVVVVGILVPAVAWLDARQRTLITRGVRPAGSPPVGMTFEEVLRPVRELSSWLSRPDRRASGAAPLAARIAPLVVWLAVWPVFAVIPFGGRYAVAGEPVGLVLADPSWGMLLAIVAPALAALGTTFVGVSGARPESLIGGVRAARQSAAALLALAASLLPMWVVYGTLRPTAIAGAQDHVLQLGGLLAALGAPPPAWLPSFAGVPAWGIVLNPPAFLLFLVASMALVGRAPFGSARASELRGGVPAELSGARRALLAAAGHAWTVAFACLAVLLFLGGGSLPWVPQATLVAWIAPFYGDGFADLVCATAHLSAFAIKLGLVLAAMVQLRWTLPGLRDDQVRALCLRVVVPLSLLDALLVALVAVAVRGTGT